MTDPSREEVLAALLSRGTDEVWNTVHGKYPVGRKLTPRGLLMKFGKRQLAARGVLATLVAEGLVEYWGRGRHAGWNLTRQGVVVASAEPPSTSVARAES